LSITAAAAAMADIPLYPLYNRTYALYRLSPLYHGDAPLLDPRACRTHAKRLKEQLKGDNVRGVQVDFASAEDTARLGPLDDCTWQVLGDEDAWIDRHTHLVDSDAPPQPSAVPATDARGIDVSLEYENQSYNALLLRDPSAPSSPKGFTSLPLLLVKMPGPIRDVFLNYLRTAFDTHVAPLKLPPAFIMSSVETYFRRLSASTSTQSIQDVIRQLNVQLAFPNTTTATLLKHVDITIAGADVPGFVTRGNSLNNGRDRPFTAALTAYLAKHLALDLSHPQVHVSRISCASFHIGTERLKLSAPDILPDTSSDEGAASQDASAGQLAVHEFYASLVREAAGDGKFVPDELAAGRPDATPSSTANAKGGRRKRAVSSAAAGSEDPKRSKAKGKSHGRKPGQDEAMDEL
jgi:hypothetical protein